MPKETSTVGRTSVTLDPELLAWAKEEAQKNPAYRNFSHLVDAALRRLKNELSTDSRHS